MNPQETTAVNEYDFKVRYTQMLQQFKELKEREKQNEAKHRQLNEYLDMYEKKNTDLSIKIKMIESELNGSNEGDIASLFDNEIKAKADKISQLESKKNEQAVAAKRKNYQNEAIVTKLKNTLKYKYTLLAEREAEYNQTLQSTSELTEKLKNAPAENADYEKKKQDLESKLAEVENELKLEQERSDKLKKELEESEQRSPDKESEELEAKNKDLQEAKIQEEARQRAIIADLYHQITSGAIEKEVAQKYYPLLKEVEAKKTAVLQEIESLKEKASIEEIEITNLNKQIKEATDKIREFKRLKEYVERSNKELTKLRKEEELNKGRVVNNTNKLQSLQQQIKNLETQSNEIKNALKYARDRNEQLKKENASAQQELSDLKTKMSKVDIKDFNYLKKQRDQLEGDLQRYKNRYEALKELQKTYYPEATLKEFKQEYEELRQRTQNIANLRKENKRLKDEYAQVQSRIDQLKERDRQAIEYLTTESKGLQTRISELEKTHSTVSKSLAETTAKVEAYSRNFPNHEYDKQRKKQEEKRLVEERNREKRQKEEEEAKEAREVKYATRKKGKNSKKSSAKPEEGYDDFQTGAPEAKAVETYATAAKTIPIEMLGLGALLLVVVVIFMFR